MIKKINIIFLILLLFFLLASVSATDTDNETLITAENQEINTMNIDTEDVQLDNAEIESPSAKENISIKTSDVDMYYKDGSKFTVTLKDKDKKAISNSEVKISINSATYVKKTDKLGTATLPLNLKSGKYNILTDFEGSEKFAPQNLKNTVNIKSTIKCSNFKKIYKNPSPYASTIYDKKGKILKDSTVKFKIKGKTYSVKSDKNGMAKININLKPGKYSIIITNVKTTESVTKSITITPTIIENNNLEKYYKNTKAFKVKIITSKGKGVGSGKEVVFTINGAKYKRITDKNSYASIKINLKPGTYTMKTSYGGCSVSNKIIVKSLIVTKDLKMTHQDGSNFNVKILTKDGKISPNQKIKLKINGKTYTRTTNKNGIASLSIGLAPGKYNIVTEYSGLKSTNKITVIKYVKNCNFKHTTLIPNYVNVTLPYVFHKSQNAIKTGYDGIIKMPKYELFIVNVKKETYTFSTVRTSEEDIITLDYNDYFIALDGSGIKKDTNKNNFKGDGIILSKLSDYTQIDYQSSTKSNTEMFGVYADKVFIDEELIIYIQNEEVMATIRLITLQFDENAIKLNLGMLQGTVDMTFNYMTVMKDNPNAVKYTNANKTVTLSASNTSIIGPCPQEDIITKFSVNNKEEIVKKETISYGLSDKYQPEYGFEFLQSYAIINEKITKNIIENSLSKKNIITYGHEDIYAMFLTSLETAWLADELADSYSKEYNVTWKREKTLTILGGIDLEKIYLHILNADMGMEVKGENATLFRLVNSLVLPEIEDYSLSEIKKLFGDGNITSSSNVLNGLANHTFSIGEIGNKTFIFDENNKNSAIIIDSNTGVSNVLFSDGEMVYKGETISNCFFCPVMASLLDTAIVSVKTVVKIKNDASNFIRKTLSKLHPILRFVDLIVSSAGTKILKGTLGTGMGIYGIMSYIQKIGTYYRDNFIDEKDWHTAMDYVTFTRPGYFHDKKVFNIPNDKGGYDYIEIEINDDLTLNRDKAIYISEGQTRNLTREETYQYFTEEYCLPFAMPEKYWDKSWRGETN